MSKVESSTKTDDKTPDKGGLGEPLYQPKDGKANVDIVFVHGVGGDRIGTWTWTDGKNPPKKTTLWPKDFLPKDMPNARVVSFGYNADFAKFYPDESKHIASKLAIDDYSNELIAALTVLRKGDEKDRPIIFVAHSMGGLVVAYTLSRAAAAPLADHTIGTIFLGTPFAGSSFATYGSIALSILSFLLPTQKGNLKTLTKNSRELTDICKKFAQFLQTRDRDHEKPRLEVACFFEQLPMIEEPVEVFVVPRESATWLGVEPLSIEANHTDMCRFDTRRRSGYGSIVGKMSGWVEEYEKSATKTGGGVGGLKAQGINITGGPNYSGVRAINTIMTGTNFGYTPDSIRIGLINNYGADGLRGQAADLFGSGGLSGSGAKKP